MTKDSLIVITPLQLKKTNIIFVEHARMKEEIPLLQETINLQDSTIKLMDTSQQIQTQQILNYKTHVGEQQKTLNELDKTLQKEIKKKHTYKGFAIGGCSVSLVLILLLL
jgi:hypothetical protein